MLDEIDRALVHALHLDGRAPFARIAAVLEVSTQTVARRYRRLRAEAGLRVVGLVDPAKAGLAQWMVRLSAVPRAAQDLAQALARREDTSWVKLASGGTEIVAIVHAPQTLLLREIPRTAGVTAVSAHYVLHLYLGGPTAWRGRARTLDAEQQRALDPVSVPDEEADGSRGLPTPADEPLLAALRRDGRTPLAELADATGWSPATVARRLAELRASRALFFDVEVDNTLFGAATQALLWMSVTPAHLDQVARELARHDELAFVAATTGPSNLVAQALCPDPAALHHYLTHRLGALEAIRTLETAPVLRTVKAAGPLVPAAPRAGNLNRPPAPPSWGS
ncbi:Lrp/AsnC family transcriptional regulator [Streptomyces sp. TLI_146]|uniref:Lrp/AsnC family transcriptional regulator n=1 Tax=Streptomyces sp. TLI_146 TaxID=1938858 RepID=UPI000C705B3C|nr:Lrp/AsnC family transcriptional regulator [Streptomyces sp. TLI_146]PKV88698.1 DNA-binding Lrp family transcriptional regulator [Streptomyces sp. TLI_146]